MDRGFRDWLAGLGRRELAALAAVGVALVVAAGVWYVRSLPRPVTVEAVPAPSPSPSPAAIFVHVAGWVRHPGVYELREGQRVADAIELAGGPRRRADLDALNLAAVLVDGQQVLVPRRAEVGVAPTAPAVGGAPSMVNLNTAALEELETLPGIGPVLAQRIIDHRERNGPFTSVEDLLEVSGIGEKRLEALRDLVVV